MIDLTEIKKLPDEEKWKIIEEIEASMEAGESVAQGEDDVDENLLQEMERRLDDMESGKDPGYTWQEAEAIWEKTLKSST